MKIEVELEEIEALKREIKDQRLRANEYHNALKKLDAVKLRNEMYDNAYILAQSVIKALLVRIGFDDNRTGLSNPCWWRDGIMDTIRDKRYDEIEPVIELSVMKEFKTCLITFTFRDNQNQKT